MQEPFPHYLEPRTILKRPISLTSLTSLTNADRTKPQRAERLYRFEEVQELPSMFSEELSGRLIPVYSAHYYEQE